MKVLLDENMPEKFYRLLPGHEVFTVSYMGWKGTRNGKLLAAAAAEAFDVLITLDTGLIHSQNRDSLPISVLLLKTSDTSLPVLMELTPSVLSALRRLRPRTFMQIPEE